MPRVKQVEMRRDVEESPMAKACPLMVILYTLTPPGTATQKTDGEENQAFKNYDTE